MKVFISWSGDRSKHVAVKLREWIPDVIQAVEPWMSTADISAGERWGPAVDRQLAVTKFGILCLTRSNTTAPWLLFEAGALAKTVEETYVCPYLIDLSPSDVPGGPLSRFQMKQADEEGTWDLVESINDALGNDALTQEQIKRAFDRWWPDLQETLTALPPEKVKDASAHRPIEEIAGETLELVRGLSRRALLVSAREELLVMSRESLERMSDSQLRQLLILRRMMQGQGSYIVPYTFDGSAYTYDGAYIKFPPVEKLPERDALVEMILAELNRRHGKQEEVPDSSVEADGE